jgi:hypothetical protein
VADKQRWYKFAASAGQICLLTVLLGGCLYAVFVPKSSGTWAPRTATIDKQGVLKIDLTGRVELQEVFVCTGRLPQYLSERDSSEDGVYGDHIRYYETEFPIVEHYILAESEVTAVQGLSSVTMRKRRRAVELHNLDQETLSKLLHDDYMLFVACKPFQHPLYIRVMPAEILE